MFQDWKGVLWIATLGLVAPWSSHYGVWKGGLVNALQCLGTDDCRCTFDDNSSTVDISTIGNGNGNPRFDDVRGDDNALYSFNPCGSFTEGNCKGDGVALCGISSNKQDYLILGRGHSVNWVVEHNTTNLTLFYQVEVQTPRLTIRESYVSLICDPEATTPRFHADGETDPDTYYFTLTTKCACPNGCPRRTSGSSKDNNLSGGSIVLIIAVVCVFVYLVGGALFKATQQGARGVEMIPNIEFWRSVPGYIRDGFRFLTRPCHRRRETYSEVS